MLPLQRHITALNNQRLTGTKDLNRDDVSCIWDRIQKLILEAAHTIIPHKKVTSSILAKKHDFQDTKDEDPFRKRRKDIRQIRLVWLKLSLHWKKGTHPTEEEAVIYNLSILKYNTVFNSTMDTLPASLNQTWLDSLKEWIKIFNLQLQQDLKKKDTENVNKFVNDRCEYVNTNQKKMLTSLLNRDFKKIILDRAVKISEDGSASLITDPDKLQAHCDDTFSQQFKSRNHLFDTNTDTWTQWKSEYEPLKHFDQNIYKNLTSEPSIEEWKNTIMDCKDKSAPGISGVGFQMLKHLPTSLVRILCKLCSILFHTGIVPEQWKWSQMYPIPKPKDWNFNVNITRPILLLECGRKVIVKIFTNRLSHICSTHNVLQGYNFAALKGGSTATPIHTISNILEDARENKKEI